MRTLLLFILVTSVLSLCPVTISTTFSAPPVRCESEAYQLTDNSFADFQPAIMEDDKGRLWAVWTSFRNGNTDIYYKIYDGEWSDEKELTNDPNSDFQPCIVEDHEGTIWVFWSSLRTGAPHIYCRRFNGTAWSDPERLTESTWNVDPTAVVDSEGRIILAWIKDYSTWSMAYDGAWSKEQMVSWQDADEEDPELCVDSSGKMWLMWNAYNSIAYKTYTGTWTSTDVLSDRRVRSWAPAAASRRNQLIVFWMTQRGISYRLYDGKWGMIKAFETAQYRVEDPAVCFSGDGTLFVAWCGAENDVASAKEIYISTIEITPRKSYSID